MSHPKKSNQNTSYTTASGQKVSIKNGVKTYSGGSSGGSSSSGSSGGGGVSSALKALSISLAKGAPVPEGVKNNSGQNVGGQVLSRPSSTLAPGVKSYDGPVPYTGTGNATPPAFTTQPTANSTPQTNPGLTPPGQSNTGTYFKQLLSFLSPSKAETDVQSEQAKAEQELRNLNRGQQQANRNIADQPIAKPFVTGQQAAIAEQYGIDRGGVTDRMQTLQQKLANLQSQRQSAIDVTKTGLDYGKYQDSQAQQSYQNQIAEQKYQDQLAQQQYENQFAQQKYATQNSPVTKQTSITPPTNSVPQGGYDSSQGTNYLSIKTADLKQKAKQMFAPAFATSLVTSLNDEQLRFFMNDFTETQNTAQQSINPEQYLNEWKAAAGIGGSTNTRSI